ncbi:hypothetical protein LTR08_007327 [Meristemomyces frigidus]|nr:hypothetical protein LTR08_007327 [Meristemomyces frigidus]
MATDSRHAAKRIKLDFSEEITVLVGADEKRFMCHKAIICSHSKFFRAACSKGFKEGEEKLVRLPEVDADVFPRYLQWAYSGEVVVASAEEVATDRGMRLDLVQLYILAEYLADALLRNAITDLLRTVYTVAETGPGAAVLCLAYQTTSDKCTLQKLMLGWHLGTSGIKYNVLGEWYDDHGQSLPVAFYMGMTIAMAKMIAQGAKAPAFADAHKCAFHEHDEEVPACK